MKSPRPLLKETDSYRVVIKGDILRDKDGSPVIIELPRFPSDAQIVSILKKAGILLKSVRRSQLTLRDSDVGGKEYRTYIYSKKEGLLLTLVEAIHSFP